MSVTLTKLMKDVPEHRSMAKKLSESWYVDNLVTSVNGWVVGCMGFYVS